MLYLTKSLCHQYKIRPARRFGQNFLIRKNIYNKIIKAADLTKEDIVLEVGPGFGFLTERLARKVRRVIAIELDKRLTEALSTRMQELKIDNVEVINQDVLKFDCFKLKNLFHNHNLNFKYKIVANLPYNITSIFLRKFLENNYRPKLMVLMLQKEVVERIIANPPQMNLLAISVQFYAKPQIIVKVAASDFWPKPKVDSAIIKLKTKDRLPNINQEDFFNFVKIGFKSKRKMLKNNLMGYNYLGVEKIEEILGQVGLDRKARAQNLSLDDWLKLFGVLQENVV